MLKHKRLTAILGSGIIAPLLYAGCMVHIPVKADTPINAAATQPIYQTTRVKADTFQTARLLLFMANPERFAPSSDDVMSMTGLGEDFIRAKKPDWPDKVIAGSVKILQRAYANHPHECIRLVRYVKDHSDDAMTEADRKNLAPYVVEWKQLMGQDAAPPGCACSHDFYIALKDIWQSTPKDPKPADKLNLPPVIVDTDHFQFRNPFVEKTNTPDIPGLDH